MRTVAERLGELRDEVVVLGGATVGLLITDPATTAVGAFSAEAGEEGGGAGGG